MSGVETIAVQPLDAPDSNTHPQDAVIDMAAHVPQPEEHLAASGFALQSSDQHEDIIENLIGSLPSHASRAMFTDSYDGFPEAIQDSLRQGSLNDPQDEQHRLSSHDDAYRHLSFEFLERSLITGFLQDSVLVNPHIQLLFDLLGDLDTPVPMVDLQLKYAGVHIT